MTAPLPISIPRQDGFYLVFQLRDHPAHQHWIDGRPTLAAASPRGSLHIVDTNAEHSSLIVAPFDSFNMTLPRAFLAALADDLDASRISALAVDEPWQTRDARLASLAPAVLDVLSDRITPSPLFADQLITTVALHVAERYGGLRRRTLCPGGLAPWQQRRACEILAADVSGHVPLAVIAAECGLSASYFGRAFKASLGVTPHGWLQARRIEAAKQLLAGSDLPLAAVAARCGFADQSHFTRMFKRATGATPGLWRRAR
ncbi:helix-turn-helix domain-containing protein [Bradyrhizobium sp. USDA 4369]